MQDQWIFIIVGVVVFVLIIALAILIRSRKKLSKSNVTSVKQFRARSPIGKPNNTSKCSYCKKKVKRLSFYAGRSGQVIGVCDQCKIQAERQALLRL